MQCVTLISATEGISTKDSYESNHNTHQFADERESAIHYVDAQPIAHDVREIEKKGVVQDSWVGSQTRKLF